MRFRDANINNLEEGLEKLIKSNFYLEEDEEEPNFKKGVFLFGNTGRGKTYALYAIKNSLKASTNKTDVETWQNLCFEMQQNFNTNRNVLGNFIANKFIFIDDIGVEKNSEWNQSMVYMVINDIYVKDKVLFITTNLSLEEFSERYGDRITDRLRVMCDFYEMKGINQRDNN